MGWRGQVAAAGRSAVPDAWGAVRVCWNRGHAVRTAAGLLALCCQAVAAVLG